MYKRAIFILSVFSLLIFGSVISSAADLQLSAKAAALIIADTGETVYAKNADECLPMASTTKIMTSLLAAEHGNPSKEITVTKEMVSVEGTSIGLLPGDTITLKTLISGMLLESGNDAANVTAYAVSGGIPQFVELMNSRAAELGMTNTSFVTPSGLDSGDHYSTAYDMALLGAAAIKNPEFLSVCSEKSEAVYYGNPPYRRTLTNHNKLLSMDGDCIGIKTGFTKKSGRCLVSAVRRDGITLVAVTLNAPDDWNDHEKMYDYGFSVVKNRELPSDISYVSLKVVGSDKQAVKTKLLYTPYLPSANENGDVTMKLSIKPFEYAPVEAGKSVGTAYYYLGDKLIAEVPIVTDESANIKYVEVKESFFDTIKNFFRKNFGEKND